MSDYFWLLDQHTNKRKNKSLKYFSMLLANA